MAIQLGGSSRKVLTFGIMGAAGCLVAAVVGEVFLALTRIAPSKVRVPHAVSLLLDCSGSMAGAKLAEMKFAANQFIERQNLSTDKIAILGFGSGVQCAAALSDQHALLSTAIAGLDDGGSTNMSAGLQAATQALSQAPESKTILIFTDGIPDSHEATLQVSQQCRAKGIRIVAVVTGDADARYLELVTGDASLVFPASSGNFAAAFKQAENAIYGRQLVESGQTAGGLAYGLARIGGWTALLAIGVSLALVAGQNMYLRRRPLAKREGIVGVLGGLAAGLVAGGTAQLIFAGAAGTHELVVTLGQIVAWAILGALLGLGVAFFIPNLKPTRGLLGGAIGGAVGGIGFILGALILGDAIGRLAGAAILGFCVGVMVALVEAVFREAWLEIRYGPNEVRTVTLGTTPLAIGSSAEFCKVLARNAPEVALRYRLENGQILCDDVPASKTIEVGPGDRRTVSDLTVVVCGSGGARKTEMREGKRETSTSITGGTTVASGTAQFHLSIRGVRVPLHDGTKLKATDIAGLEPQTRDGAIAEVVRNPANPSVLGLKNLSLKSWSAKIGSDDARAVEPGRSVTLAVGTRIKFVNSEGVIE